MAGQEGFEPTTRGFGIRCSTIGATGLDLVLLSFSPSLRVVSADSLLRGDASTGRSFSFDVNRVFRAAGTELLERQGLALLAPARLACRLVVAGSALTTRKNHRRSRTHSMIFVMTPAPTVFPPSRIANRCFSSIATGVMSSTLMRTLSPGMTIFTSSGSLQTPVTSVVRM
jgi:hypothetical protein